MKDALVYFSAVAFIFYGTVCLTTGHMKTEFRRWGMEGYRTLTGALELLGGVGLLLGFWYHPLMIMASAGLATLMLMGSIVRLKSKDSFKNIIPAFSLMLINSYILYRSLTPY